MELVFNVNKQIITRADAEKVVRGSRNYLFARFNFSEEWTGLKTAVFSTRTKSYNMLLDSDRCLVPWEVLRYDRFEVSVFCGSLITSNKVVIETIESGYNMGDTSAQPTPDIYNQIIEKINNIETGDVDPEAVGDIVAEYIEDHKAELKGEKGDTGAQGIQGEKGDKGENGNDGASGKSAYELAIAMGYSGDLASWLASLKGESGESGTTPEISITATVDNTTGTPGVQVSKSGTDENPSFTFAFTGLKGQRGDSGEGGGSGEAIINPLYDDSGFDEYSSIDMMHNMLIGWNLGNQFESYDRLGVEKNNVINLSMFYETLWGNPKVSRELIGYVASLGIQAVRVPVTWGNLVDPNNGVIDTGRLERIKSVVDDIINNGMYCIINVHHDGAHKWHKMVFDADHYQETMSYLINLWKQIGDYFKDYGYKLLFEGYNEVTDNSGTMSLNDTRENIACKFAQAFIDTIRVQGSNNAKRFLVIPNYGGVSLMRVAKFQTLTDSATDKLLITTHIYPSNANVSSYIANCRTRSRDLGIGVIVDEIGIMPSDNYDNEFAANVRSAADEYQISTFWWDNGTREYNIIDRVHCQPSNNALAAYLGKAVARKTYTYTELENNVLMPYCAKFYTSDADNTYNSSPYLVVCSQKPITALTVSGDSRGYYSISGNEGGLYSIYVSDDDVTYNLIESMLMNTAVTTLIGVKHVLWGTTDNTYYVEGNYIIDNVPVAVVECTGITATTPISITDSGNVTYTLEPSNCTQSVSFVSSDTSIIAVSDAGAITVHATGTATITITCGSQSAVVTVNATKSETPTPDPTPSSDSLVTVDPTNERLNSYSPIPKTYKYVVNLSNKDYLYESDYPMYMLVSSDGKYQLIFASDIYRNGASYSSSYIADYDTINGIAYKIESSKRTQDVLDTAVANYPIISVDNADNAGIER